MAKPASRPWRRPLLNLSRIYTTLSFSSSSASSSAAAAGDDSLYQRLSRAGNPRTSMVPILEQWLQEGRSVNQDELRFLVTRLRKFRRYIHALQISEWMGEIRSMNFSRRDFAVHLDLTAKVHGIERAELYFEMIPCYMRAPQSYGALLNCYAYTKSPEKAEAIMQKFQEFGFDKSTYPYNVMLKLYYHLGRYDEMDNVTRQMEAKGIAFDDLTYNIRLNAFVLAGDVKGMESFIMKMEADPCYRVNWQDYAIAANGYLKSGLLDKAQVSLKKAEQLAVGKSKKNAYHTLLTMYARVKSRDDVYRLWDSYKGSFHVYNKGYTCMVSSLVILGDVEAAEKVVDENLSRSYDVQFFATNLLLRAYFEISAVEKAEKLIEKAAVKHGKEARAFTWDAMATGYYKHGRMEDAVNAMKKALSTIEPQWKPNKLTLVACLDYLRVKGDSRELEEFMRLLGDTGKSVMVEDKSVSSDANEEMELYEVEEG
ncbi:hypothetical protein Droror1_Dr00003940 [Drosera rotundifolia]